MTEDYITNKLAKLKQLSLEKSQSKEIRLPDWHESKRGTPNSFLRSSLFSTLPSKDRQYKKELIIFCQNGLFIRYTGELLNQEDLTLWETIVQMSKKHPLGIICEFTAYQILTNLGMNTGKSEYEWLERGIDRLTACMVKINFNGNKYGRSLIIGYEKHESSNYYRLEVCRDMIRLYGQSDWTAIDWTQRATLRKKPLAQYLHAYYSSHKNPYPVKVITLHQLSGSRVEQLRYFKRNLKSALEDLVKINFLESYSFKGDLVIVTRK
jgi:hypothetical protein